MIRLLRLQNLTTCPSSFPCILIFTRNVNQNPEIRDFGFLETNFGSRSLTNEIQIYLFFRFCQGNYIKITKCQVKLINTFV